MSKILLAFDNDGVLRDESVSYLRCIRETVAHFDSNKEADEAELVESMKESNDDWERTYNILTRRGVDVDFSLAKEYFQDLYLGKNRDFSGYINNEEWLADNSLLAELSSKYDLIIISGAQKQEIVFNLKRYDALKYFKLILGMSECKDKHDGMMQARNLFNPDQVFFCDDRPSPLKKLEIMKKDFKLNTFGIIPPKTDNSWSDVLLDAGAEKVFLNVNEYCRYILENIR